MNDAMVVSVAPPSTITRKVLERGNSASRDELVNELVGFTRT